MDGIPVEEADHGEQGEPEENQGGDSKPGPGGAKGLNHFGGKSVLGIVLCIESSDPLRGKQDMKIIAVADVHGSYDVVEKILQTEQPFDAVVLAGDVTTKGTARELESAILAVRKHGPPVMAVAGNMDPPHLEQSLEALGVSLNGKGRVIGAVGFFGVSSCPVTPFHTPYEIDEKEIARRADAGWVQVEGAPWTVFVPHAPPRGTKLDRTFTGMHVGSTAVRDFVEKRHPHVVVCGHIHEARGIDALGKSQMVNCGPAERGFYAVITIAETVQVACRSLEK
jgi:Icc-related predicted phosphoesterase